MPRPRWKPPQVLFRAGDVAVGPDVLRRAEARGDLVRLQRGVYLAAGQVPDDAVHLHLVRATAVQMVRPGLIASHQTAALAHGLPLLDSRAADGDLTFTRPRGPNARFQTAPRVVVRDLPRGSVQELPLPLGDLRVTTATRTALDLACELPLAEALMATDHVARRAAGEFLVSGQLRGRLNERARQLAIAQLLEAQVDARHHRSGPMLALSLTDARRESPGESVSFGRIVAAGLPTPECQHPFRLATGVVHVDFWWEEFGLVGECDGKVKYDGTFGADDGVLVAEADRYHGLLTAGADVVRWRAADMMYRPTPVLARVADRLRANGWRG